MTAPIRLIDRPRRSRKQLVSTAILAAVAILMLTAGLLANVSGRDDLSTLREKARKGELRQQTAIAPPNLVKPLTPEEAIRINQERPFDAPPDTPAGKFQIRTDQNSRDRALECLTQAVYYEAASESADGQRAVAQVVLNRMRHPGFPSSVCGVVYQGSELPTGCQFTFTCDGSLNRMPVPAMWARAKKIAVDALAGHVFAAVGHSTHYHADYVLPYWADSLAKQVQIGHHIFYRLRGALGSSAAFSQRYAGAEPSPPPAPSEVTVTAAEQAQALLNSGFAGDVPHPLVADAVGGASEPQQVLLADSNKGSLLIDNIAPARGSEATTRKMATSGCPEQYNKRVLPTAPSDLHANRNEPAC